MHHINQIVTTVIASLQGLGVNIYDNESLAIDDPGASVGVYVPSTITTVDDEQRFQPTAGLEQLTLTLVSRPALSSTSPRYDAIELAGSAQKAIFASVALFKLVASVARTDMQIDLEVRSEGATAFAAQTYTLTYITLDNDPETIK
jgi:hypothetical protein